jgi:hypothetical protein
MLISGAPVPRMAVCHSGTNRPAADGIGVPGSD